MNNLRRNFERFCYRNRNKGIPNLMLYIVAGTALMYLMAMLDPSQLFYRIFQFDREAILQGQVWRLLTYILLPVSGTNILVLAISLYFYYYIGKTLENHWGSLRFNLFYLCGVLITDAAALLLGINASISSLNLSLLLAYATIYPENRVLLFYIIPLKIKYMAWFYFGLTIYELIVYPFPYNLFSVCALLNYFLFFGSDVFHVLPGFLQPKGRSQAKSFGDFGSNRQKPNPNWAKDYQKKASQPLYRHKCTVCGKTDADNPHLEFRYCSRCSGYRCYCIEHINDHPHIQ